MKSEPRIERDFLKYKSLHLKIANEIVDSFHFLTKKTACTTHEKKHKKLINVVFSIVKFAYNVRDYLDRLFLLKRKLLSLRLLTKANQTAIAHLTTNALDNRGNNVQREIASD